MLDQIPDFPFVTESQKFPWWEKDFNVTALIFVIYPKHHKGS